MALGGLACKSLSTAASKSFGSLEEGTVIEKISYGFLFGIIIEKREEKTKQNQTFFYNHRAVVDYAVGLLQASSTNSLSKVS